MKLEKPDCISCEHNKALIPSVLRQCDAGAFSMLQSSDCKDLPFFILTKCPKFVVKKQNNSKEATD